MKVMWGLVWKLCEGMCKVMWGDVWKLNEGMCESHVSEGTCEYFATTLIFDRMVLCAVDCGQKHHWGWRKSLLITILRNVQNMGSETKLHKAITYNITALNSVITYKGAPINAITRFSLIKFTKEVECILRLRLLDDSIWTWVAWCADVCLLGDLWPLEGDFPDDLDLQGKHTSGERLTRTLHNAINSLYIHTETIFSRA